MTDSHDTCGCGEYRALSRRGFMATAGANMAALSLPAWLPDVAYRESEDTARDVIVSIFMRGGADGLTLVAPFGDPLYYTGRPTIAVPRPDSSSPVRGVALDNFFMFPQGMLGMYPAYQAGDLAVIHATGQRFTTSRSHFEAERYMEAGKPNDYSLVTGWLARHLATSTPSRANAPLRALALGWGGTRLTLTGAPKTLPIPVPGSYNLVTPVGAQLDRLYAGAWAPARSAARDGIATVNLLKSIDFRGYRPANGATYSNSDFNQGLRSLAALVKADVGVEAAHMDIGGWDTHANQGPTSGQMHQLMTDFANGVGAFWADVVKAPTNYRVTLVAISEFGRNARENGSMGTDHGRGSVAFVMGTAIAGGRVLAQWPGLSQDVLEDGQDLKVTMDYRDILAEVVTQRLGNPNLSYIFPGYTPVIRGITK